MTTIGQAAIAAAAYQSANGPQYGIGQCMMRTRILFGAPAIGDYDGDGSADAEDGWKYAKLKHATTDPTAIPAAAPVWWGGGSHDNGHVAVSASGGMCWSTDILRDGYYDLVPIDLIRQKWGLPLLGWTEDIDGVLAADLTIPEVPSMGMRPDFFDLSHWNDGPFDFPAAKRAGLLLGILKATESTTYVDPAFADLKRQVKAAGLLVGAYCFARPATLSKAADNAVTHARLFVATAGKDCDVYALDLETRGLLATGRLTTWVREWVAEVRRLTGKPAGAVWVYTKFDLTDNANAPLWTARYSNSNAAPYVAKPWKAWTAWQYTNGVYGVPSGTPGVGHVDASQLNSSDPAGLLAALLADTPAPKPTTPTEDDMPYSDWPKADKDALVSDVTEAIVTAISNRQLIDTSEVGAGGKDLKSSLPYAVKLLLRQGLAAGTALETLSGVGPDVAAIRGQVEKDAPAT